MASCAAAAMHRRLCDGPHEASNSATRTHLALVVQGLGADLLRSETREVEGGERWAERERGPRGSG